MTEKQFLQKHQILCRRIGQLNQWIVIDKFTGGQRKYNFNLEAIDPISFEFWTGYNLDDVEINEISAQLRFDYGIID